MVSVRPVTRVEPSSRRHLESRWVRIEIALEVQVLRRDVVVDGQVRCLSAGPIAVVGHALHGVTGGGDVRRPLLEVGVGVDADLAQGQGGIVDRHAVDVAVEIVEEVTAVFRLGAVADTDEARQRDGGLHGALVGAVDVQVRRAGVRAGDEGQMRDGAGVVGHAVVIIGHTKERSRRKSRCCSTART